MIDPIERLAAWQGKGSALPECLTHNRGIVDMWAADDEWTAAAMLDGWVDVDSDAVDAFCSHLERAGRSDLVAA